MLKNILKHKKMVIKIANEVVEAEYANIPVNVYKIIDIEEDGSFFFQYPGTKYPTLSNWPITDFFLNQEHAALITEEQKIKLFPLLFGEDY